MKKFEIVSVPYRGATFLNFQDPKVAEKRAEKFPSPIGELHFSIFFWNNVNCFDLNVSVPYRGATFLNYDSHFTYENWDGGFRPLSGSYISQLFLLYCLCSQNVVKSFRPLSGSYISQYHPRNPMSCLGRIGGLRGKSNFIEIQPFWKVKSSHKSSI